MRTSLTRRRFLATNLRAALAASAFPLVVSPAVLGRGAGPGPNGRVNIGCIGMGPQGRGVMSGFLGLKGVRVVAVCDVSARHREEARRQIEGKYGSGGAGGGGGCGVYEDYRELLGRADVDGVLIATPDHWHVPMAVAAARAGKDIYLEKPMGLAVAEDQALQEAVRSAGRVFQFGTQQRSSGEFRRAVEWVRSGRIGKLRRIHVWSPASRPGGSMRKVAVPEGWDFERWLGPAPAVSCTEGLLADDEATGAWKTWWYRSVHALGFIAGWGVHPLDVALWGYPGMMGGPMTVEGRGLFPESGACDTAIAWDVEFGLAGGVTMRFKGTPNGWDGANALNDLRDWRERYGGIEGHGTAFEGEDGWICVHRGAVRTSLAGLAEERNGREVPGVVRSEHHAGDLVAAMRSRGPTVCGIEEAVRADLLCHLSELAIRLGRRLRWDPGKEAFAGDDEANGRLGFRPVRAPWEWRRA